jgi:hypothetical protein
MKLFTADIDKKLFAQYLKGSDLANQVVVAKIFNPYGRGTWYLLNSDPEDPEYLWAIVDLGDIEVGSVNRSDLENIRIKPFMLGLERDLSFTPMNAAEIYRGLNSGKTYAKGGGVTMKHPKSYYQDLPSYSGYKWVGFDKGKHIFQKKEAKGYSVIEALESDLTNGNIEFMAEHGLTNTNKKATGGGVGEDKLFDVTVFYEDTKAKADKFGIKSKQFWRKQYKINAKNEDDAKQEIYKQFISEKANKNKIAKNLTAFELKRKKATGGGVGDYKLKDVVDFYYGRADEKKIISGTITDILNDGYTISTGFTQVMVKPSEIVGYSKQAEPKKKRFGIFADGGGVDSENKEMVLNNNKQIAHHTKELSEAVRKSKYVPAWVVAKVNRSASDLSDAAHYMEGQEGNYETGGGVGDKKMYEITFEDVFSFATAVRAAQLTDSQYQKAIQQMKNKDVVVDKFNEKQGIREQLRIKEITPKFKTGGGVDELIGKKVKVFYEPLSTTKDNEKLPYYYYQFKGLNSTRRQNGTVIDIFIGDEKQNYYKDKYSVKVHFENDKIGIYRLRYVEVQDYKKMATGGGMTKKEFISEKVGKVMHEFKQGDLHSGKSGKIVKNPKQAIAIALSEGKRGWKHKK